MQNFGKIAPIRLSSSLEWKNRKMYVEAYCNFNPCGMEFAYSSAFL